jgi:hypothetical protein
LPFSSDSFDLVVCSHLLFLYSAELSLAAHVASLEEMLGVGKEVRVFPLLDMDGRTSEHLEGCAESLSRAASVEVIDVLYEFRMGDSRMLRLVRKQ